MKDFALFAKTFNINNTSAYHISIQLGTAGYSYCIIDTIRKGYIALKNVNYGLDFDHRRFLDAVKDSLANDAFLNRNYKSVDFIYVTPKSMLIPNEYFDKNTLKSYFKFNFVLDEYEELHYNKLPGAGACNVFAVSSFITTLLVNKFPEIRFYHQATPFIETNLKLDYKSMRIEVNFQRDFFNIIVVEADKLLLYNTYSFQTPEDAVYYILNTLNTLGMKPAVTEIVLSGRISTSDKLFISASRYLNNIRFAKLNNDLFYEFRDIPQHNFMNILNINQCE